ncbi:MAG: excisionase [Proteobacteria bacterium]|nr:excisionase [Pseudomonadota bacterium]MBS0494586.1 excisionase [Pseudomonadota bacterium]
MQTAVSSESTGLVTVRKAAELTGLSEKAIRRKREEGIWLEGREIVVGPDKRIYVDIAAFQKWVRGLQ